MTGHYWSTLQSAFLRRPFLCSQYFSGPAMRPKLALDMINIHFDQRVGEALQNSQLSCHEYCYYDFVGFHTSNSGTPLPTHNNIIYLGAHNLKRWSRIQAASLLPDIPCKACRDIWSENLYRPKQKILCLYNNEAWEPAKNYLVCYIVLQASFFHH